MIGLSPKLELRRVELIDALDSGEVQTVIATKGMRLVGTRDSARLECDHMEPAEIRQAIGIWPESPVASHEAARRAVDLIAYLEAAAA